MFCSCFHEMCQLVAFADTHDSLPQHGSEKLLCTAVENGVSRKYSLYPLVLENDVIGKRKFVRDGCTIKKRTAGSSWWTVHVPSMMTS